MKVYAHVACDATEKITVRRRDDLERTYIVIGPDERDWSDEIAIDGTRAECAEFLHRMADVCRDAALDLAGKKWVQPA